jgi:hypothetical protein
MLTNLIRATAVTAASVTLLLIAAPASAHGRADINWSINIGAPYGYAAPTPVIYAPAPVVYVQQQPAYVTETPVIGYRTGYPGYPGYYGRHHRPHYREVVRYERYRSDGYPRDYEYHRRH